MCHQFRICEHLKIIIFSKFIFNHLSYEIKTPKHNQTKKTLTKIKHNRKLDHKVISNENSCTLSIKEKVLIWKGDDH